MLVDWPGADTVERSEVAPCRGPVLRLTPSVRKAQLLVRSGKGIADLIDMKAVAHFRVADEAIDAILLRGPMAINHLRQGSPAYVPLASWFDEESELTHTVESRYS